MDDEPRHPDDLNEAIWEAYETLYRLRKTLDCTPFVQRNNPSRLDLLRERNRVRDRLEMLKAIQDRLLEACPQEQPRIVSAEESEVWR